MRVANLNLEDFFEETVFLVVRFAILRTVSSSTDNIASFRILSLSSPT